MKNLRTFIHASMTRRRMNIPANPVQRKTSCIVKYQTLAKTCGALDQGLIGNCIA